MALRRNFPEGFVEPCIPIRATRPPSGPDWIHEIKHDGYRLIVRRDGETVRLFIRRGHDWTERYPGSPVSLRSCGRDCSGQGCGVNARGVVTRT
jgi:ATP-dependent DNA ligase